MEAKTVNHTSMTSWTDEVEKVHIFASLGVSQWLDEVPARRHDMVSKCLSRYFAADWGDLDDDDKQANNAALVSGARILAAYHLDGRKIWIITEAKNNDGRRAYTTILFPEEY